MLCPFKDYLERADQKNLLAKAMLKNLKCRLNDPTSRWGGRQVVKRERWKGLDGRPVRDPDNGAFPMQPAETLAGVGIP